MILMNIKMMNCNRRIYGPPFLTMNITITTKHYMVVRMFRMSIRMCMRLCRSVGICILELADGRPPLSDLHPMRALMQVTSQINLSQGEGEKKGVNPGERECQ